MLVQLTFVLVLLTPASTYSITSYSSGQISISEDDFWGPFSIFVRSSVNSHRPKSTSTTSTTSSRPFLTASNFSRFFLRHDNYDNDYAYVDSELEEKDSVDTDSEESDGEDELNIPHLQDDTFINSGHTRKTNSGKINEIKVSKCCSLGRGYNVTSKSCINMPDKFHPLVWFANETKGVNASLKYRFQIFDEKSCHVRDAQLMQATNIARNLFALSPVSYLLIITGTNCLRSFTRV